MPDVKQHKLKSHVATLWASADTRPGIQPLEERRNRDYAAQLDQREVLGHSGEGTREETNRKWGGGVKCTHGIGERHGPTGGGMRPTSCDGSRSKS
eukprot:14005378-Alexandrium_andersonii.AAC.1